MSFRLVVLLAALLPLTAVSAPPVPATSPAAAVRSPPVRIPEASLRYRLALEREVIGYFGLDAPVSLVAGQIHAESTWEPTARSAYAEGLGQFTPPTARWLPTVCPEIGEPDPWDAAWSLRAVACYDAWLFERMPAAATVCDRWAFTLSSYNGGQAWLTRDRARASAKGADPARWFGHVERHSPRSAAAMAENRSYVTRILLRLQPAYIAAGWPGEAPCP